MGDRFAVGTWFERGVPVSAKRGGFTREKCTCSESECDVEYRVACECDQCCVILMLMPLASVVVVDR